MKPRQIKKNSKSAMDLLIKVFGGKRIKFYLEINDTTKLKQWVFIYSDSHESYAINALSNQLFFQTCEWVNKSSSGWEGKQPKNGIDLNNIPLIQYCRKLAKAGVKYEQ